MDAFYVSVELMRRPELRGKPVVVAGSGPRAVVTTASYEARKYGVFSAIPAARARRLCPEATFIAPDPEAYRAMSKRVMDRVRAQVETVEVMGLDEAYLELTGLYSPRAAMRRLISEVKADTGLTASVGIGPNRLVAKVASDAEKPQGFVVLTREQACERFADAPPRLIPGIGPKTAERLEELGIATIARLAATPPETLTERFGARMGLYLLARARFEDDTPVSNERIAVSESRETTFDTDVADRSEQAGVLRRLTGQLCEGLAKHERRGRTIAHQGAARRLHDRDPRPHAAGGHQRPGGRLRRRLRAARRVRAAAAGAAARRARGLVRGRRAGGRDAADDAGTRDLGPIATGSRDRRGCTMDAMTTTETRTASQIITDEVTAWPGVEAGLGRRGEYGFTVGRKQIGHLHGDSVAHFGFPKAVWQELYDAGRITYHPVFPDKKGWASRRIESDDDVRDVIAMLRLNYDRAAG